MNCPTTAAIHLLSIYSPHHGLVLRFLAMSEHWIVSQLFISLKNVAYEYHVLKLSTNKSKNWEIFRKI